MRQVAGRCEADCNCGSVRGESGNWEKKSRHVTNSNGFIRPRKHRESSLEQVVLENLNIVHEANKVGNPNKIDHDDKDR